MSTDNLRSKVVKGVLWTLLEMFTTHFASFSVTLVLARLLTPADYGTVALLTLVINMSSVIIDSGFGQALVQKKNATDLDFNSVFYLNIAVASLVYVVLYFAAPAIAAYYSHDELISLLRVLAGILVINAVGGVQSAELSRKMLFNRSFKISMVRFAATSATGISLAFCGFGPWALVWSSVMGAMTGVCASWRFIGWRPKLMFSWRALKGLFSFGWKFSASWFLSVAYDNVYGMIVGKMYSPTDLAYMEKGRQVPQMALSSINGALQRVSFPAMASIQDDLSRVRSIMRRMIQCSTFLIFPMMVGLAVCAKDVILIFFGDQWGRSVPFLAIYCLGFLLYPFHTINLQTLSAIGRSDIFLKLEIIKKVISAVILVCTCHLGVLKMVCFSVFLGGPIGVFVNAYPNQRLLGYTVMMQVRDAMPSLLMSAVMAASIYPIEFLGLSPWPTLILRILSGGMVYFVIAFVFRSSSLQEYAKITVPVLSGRLPSCVAVVYCWVLSRLGINISGGFQK